MNKRLVSIFTLSFALLLASAGSAQAQTPDARRINETQNITGEVVRGSRNAKHRLRIVYRETAAQDLLIEAERETVFANLMAAYVAYRNKDSASKDFAVVVSPSGWQAVIYWPEVVMLQRWTEP